MKTKVFIYLLVAFMGLGMVSCEDMLSPDSERHSYNIGQDTLYSYWGIMRSWQNIAERYVILGECRGELVSGTSYVSDSIQPILNFEMDKATDGSCRYLQASDYYHVINSCNSYLAKYDSTRVTGKLEPYMQKEAAQVQAIRAWTYLQMIQVYGEVPFYTQPLLTTDDIKKFMGDDNKVKANADNLADLLIADLEKAALIEKTYGYPQYQNYGYSSTVCHSTKAMIPLNLIMGDLYLTKGDKVSCEKAAQYYENYLTADQTFSKVEEGGALPSGYNCIGLKGENADKASYILMGGTPWTETGAQAADKESITAIPSSTNKLWGDVLRGVNEIFGYSVELSVRTGEQDTVTTASVSLTPSYDKKQITASTAYYDLCKAQKFEEYIGAELDKATLQVDPNVGDARQYWVRDVRQTYSNGVSNTEKFVTKQNPGGDFTTVYPMIYRKSQVWLRYAEALCGAGYPSYAFAVLKDGLCNNSSWIPTADTEDFAVKDSAYYYTIADSTTTDKVDTFPAYDESILGGSPYRTKDELIAAIESELGIATDDIKLANIGWRAAAYQNWGDEASNKVLNYLDLREVRKAPDFVKFNYSNMEGNWTANSVVLRSSLVENYAKTTTDTYDSDEKLTNGIHSRGCGYVKYADRHNSAYNYVDMVAQKAQENYNTSLTKEDIYSGEYDDIVQKCVEDLIVDEEALELAFEGTRFFDLMRVAHRRNDASYLANKLGQRNSTLKTKLLSEKNWYFELPNY